jgi:hypothetical protein
MAETMNASSKSNCTEPCEAKAVQASSKGDCAKSCDSAAKTVAAKSGSCSEAKSACSGAMKASYTVYGNGTPFVMPASFKASCESSCDGKAETVSNTKGECSEKAVACDAEKTACAGSAKSGKKGMKVANMTNSGATVITAANGRAPASLDAAAEKAAKAERCENAKSCDKSKEQCSKTTVAKKD